MWPAPQTPHPPIKPKKVDVSSLPTLREGEEFTDASGAPAEATASSRPRAEQLEHWQRNRRTLAYSTVGTPDYIAPGGGRFWGLGLRNRALALVGGRACDALLPCGRAGVLPLVPAEGGLTALSYLLGFLLVRSAGVPR